MFNNNSNVSGNKTSISRIDDNETIIVIIRFFLYFMIIGFGFPLRSNIDRKVTLRPSDGHFKMI